MSETIAFIGADSVIVAEPGATTTITTKLLSHASSAGAYLPNIYLLNPKPL